MKNLIVKDNLELVLRKANWVKEILSLAQKSEDGVKAADLLAAAEFIVDSLTDDAENAYQALDSNN